ncbi:hypothetical protein C0J52_25061 [Blattella germanica]|nr:hypothetical protein C0J52_25061 [Blattella germanica]
MKESTAAIRTRVEVARSAHIISAPTRTRVTQAFFLAKYRSSCTVAESEDTTWRSQVLLSGAQLGAEYEEISVDPERPILPDTTVAPAGDFLYVLSTAKVRPHSVTLGRRLG